MLLKNSAYRVRAIPCPKNDAIKRAISDHWPRVDISYPPLKRVRRGAAEDFFNSIDQLWDSARQLF
jgi:hypothetical protein